MNLSLLVVIAGAFFLFIPVTMWLGIAFLAIGAVTYTMVQKRPVAMAPGQPKYLPAWPQMPPQKEGFGWELRDLKQDELDRGLVTKKLARRGPYVEQGMFNLPLPMNPEIAELVDLKYKKPTGGRGVKIERDSGGNPWIPGF